MNAAPPLIAHVVYHFGTGGMENGMTLLFNHLPRDKYRHVVISLTGHGEFRNRIARDDIAFYDVDKKPGHDYTWAWRLAKLLRQLKPDVLHTRNLNAMEAQWVGALAGVRGRVHGEHGRDMYDLHGKNWKYNLLRRATRRVVHRYIAVSQDLEHWLKQDIGVPPARVRQIYNGVDGERFRPRAGAPSDPEPRAGERPVFDRADFFAGASCVIGSVGRLVKVKDFPTLLRAFAQACARHPDAVGLRLVIVGEGPERGALEALARELGIVERLWLPGDRRDIPELLRAFDVFALPSLGEGISNTILEAMASGLPVIATRVGGNPELIRAGENGSLVAVGDADALADVLLDYIRDADRRKQEGESARARVERDFIIPRMVENYARVYDEVLRTD
jgi:sugar transferase (PEP-CTERM/EpsH1 system associated)